MCERNSEICTSALFLIIIGINILENVVKCNFLRYSKKKTEDKRGPENKVDTDVINETQYN